MFGFIGGFLRGLWRIANFWRIPPFENASAGVRVGSNSAALLMFLVMLFAIIATLLVLGGALFGVSPEATLAAADRWIDAIAPGLAFVGAILIQKVLMAIVLALCVFMSVAYLFFRKAQDDTPGWGKTILIVLLCLMVGYCSAVNLAAPLDP